MKIVIFGATGTVGLQLVRQAIDAGHQVTAFARSPEKLLEFASQIEVVQGDVLAEQSRVAIEDAVRGQDVVMVALGGGIKGRIRSEGTKNVIHAMQKTGVRKLVCQSTLGAGASARQLNLKWRLIFGGPLRWAMSDHQQQEAYVRASGLDWTIVRPGAFTDGPLTGNYQVVDVEEKPKMSLSVSRADVAHCLLQQLADWRHQFRPVTISY